MYIGFFNCCEIYNQNRMFTPGALPEYEDWIYPTIYLAQYLKERGHSVNTIDMDDIRNFDAIVFIDFPTLQNKYFIQLISAGFSEIYMILIESKVVRQDNWNIENHRYFKKIFTWNDTLIDNKKYFKINYSHKIPKELNFNLSEKKKLCVMVNSNKFFSHPLELYTERIRAINWFEKNHPDDFDLYGFGWDKHNFSSRSFRKLNRFNFLCKLLRPRYKTYKGSVKSKKETISKYKFAICYENARDIPGYITEKIFNCFFSGCVPIYLGAPNVTDYIPQETFIDKRNFKTYEEIYSYIKNMPDTEYIDYLNAIKNFVLSDRIYPFSAECFVETLVREIIDNK